MKKKDILSFIVLSVLILTIVYIARYTTFLDSLSLTELQKEDHFLRVLLKQNYYYAAILYIALFSVVIGVGFPGSPALTIFAGYLFGVLNGTFYAMIGSIIGATTSFLIFRYILHDTINRRKSPRTEYLQQQMHTHGPSYLLTMHFMTVIPYFIINAVAAISDISLGTFIVITAIGSFPLILIYAFSGEQLSTITSVGDIFSVPIIATLLLLALLALLPTIIRSFKNNKKH